MITSAGCNALDYLLHMPEQIDCVDMNPHQTALVDLKLVALRWLDHCDFFAMFGEGRLRDHRAVYRDILRPRISESSQIVWDRRIDYFDPEGCGFYYHGTSGFFARILARYIESRQGLRNDLDEFQTIESIELQAQFYRTRIAPKLWSPELRWIMRKPAALSLLGVPVDQIRQMQATGALDVSSFIEERLERMFTTVPIRENYFWRVYINGRYSPDCCPNYLRPENFQLLRWMAPRLHLHTGTLTEFLWENSGPFSIFVLLDHMDWLTSKPELLQQEWNCILRSAKPGARIIYRSGGTSFDRVPTFAKRKLEFESSLAEALSIHDRVGTYGSFYLARVIA